MNMVMYKISRWPNFQLFISETWFDRNMSYLVNGAENTRTIIFPNTVRKVRCDAFKGNRSLRSAVLNEGLERLKGYMYQGCDEDGDQFTEIKGVFQNSGLQRVILPSTLRVLGDGTFCYCSKLKSVTFAEGSKLEKIGSGCFQNSGLEEITLPKALTDVDYCAFDGCRNLRTIYVEDGCEADLSSLRLQDSTQAGPLPETMVGNVRVWDLRGRKDIVIPEGVERIGNYWFWDSGIENVTVPASVREIGTDAFCYC